MLGSSISRVKNVWMIEYFCFFLANGSFTLDTLHTFYQKCLQQAKSALYLGKKFILQALYFNKGAWYKQQQPKKTQINILSKIFTFIITHFFGLNSTKRWWNSPKITINSMQRKFALFSCTFSIILLVFYRIWKSISSSKSLIFF